MNIWRFEHLKIWAFEYLIIYIYLNIWTFGRLNIWTFDHLNICMKIWASEHLRNRNLQECRNCWILPSRMGKHGVRLENMGNMENMENMEMFSGSPTEIFSVSPTDIFSGSPTWFTLILYLLNLLLRLKSHNIRAWRTWSWVS